MGAHFFAILDALGKLKMIAGRGFVTAIYSQSSENDFKFNWTKKVIVERLKAPFESILIEGRKEKKTLEILQIKAEQIEMQLYFKQQEAQLVLNIYPHFA